MADMSRRLRAFSTGAAALRAVEDPIKGQGCLGFRASPGLLACPVPYRDTCSSLLANSEPQVPHDDMD